MSEYYRFRSVDALLGEHAELQRQSIYFASPEELNDPMEGLADFYWKGDAVAWRNLIRHFFTCLIHAVTQYEIVREEQKITWDHLPWRNTSELPPIPLTQKTKELAGRFLATEELAQLVEYLVERDVGVTEEELHTHLRCIHGLAVIAIRADFEAGGLMPPGKLPAPKKLELSPFLAGLNALFQDKANAAKHLNVARAIFRSTNHMFDQLQTITRLQNSLDARANFDFVYLDFCRAYLGQVKKLVHPDWYAACFVNNFRNASMWGHYAQGHTGVCLKFRSARMGDSDSLSLSAPSTANLDGPQWIRQKFPFKRITYGDSRPMINFFATLGRLPMGAIRDCWYTDVDGRRSELMESVFNREGDWREEYWSSFDASITRKLNDWKYEEEYRLTFWSNINDISDPSMRVLTYDFADLEGIIFGIRTSEADKLRIIRLIHDKCAETGRKEFNFFQAAQERDPDRVEAQPLSLIKFKFQ
ncbi:MAG TPA: DUF2971 domain-containing protein [Rhodanobacteraceae bacterium]|nr:DUF2971 domain-containing protein [Rhodanobacteraceae bacterium]